MTARNDFLAEDHGLLPARPTGPQLDAPASDDDAWRDFPWPERDLSTTTQRFQTATWIEEILADVDSEMQQR